MKKLLWSSILMLVVIHLSAQNDEKKAPMFGISFSGYVNTDIMYDSRQTVNARDGQFLLYPENKRPDADGNDINAHGTFNILSIQTRVTGKITGPDIFGAKSSGVIEGEFFGNINPNINTFRLRLAYTKLAWKTTELILGQYWHPMYVPTCAPEVLSLNSGAPFLVFTRNPQVRLSQDIGKVRFQLSAITQVDVPSPGPEGPNPKYLRNSILPEINFLVQFSSKNEEMKREFLVGASIDYLMLTPRLATEITVSPAYDTVIDNLVYHHDAVIATYKTNSKSVSLNANVFAKMKWKKVTVKIGGVYGGDCFSFNMIGGYAVKSVTDPEKGFVDYGNLRTASAWGEFKTNGTKWQIGLFAGYSKNLGATSDLVGPYYSRGSDISYLYRISPRVSLNVSKLKIGAELEYTVAGYGKTESDGTVTEVSAVGNLRVLTGIMYYF